MSASACADGEHTDGGGIARLATRTFKPYTKAEIIEALQWRPEDATIDDAMESLYIMAKIEIVETLIACESQAHRCRSQYDAGLGAETMRDLELMLQRLEFVSTTFRAVMGQLRELAGRAIAPPAEAAPISFGRWCRSA